MRFFVSLRSAVSVWHLHCFVAIPDFHYVIPDLIRNPVVHEGDPDFRQDDTCLSGWQLFVRMTVVRQDDICSSE